MDSKRVYRGSIFYFKQTANLSNLPAKKDKDSASSNAHEYVYLEDGLLFVQSGKIVDVGHTLICRKRPENLK